MRKLSLRAKLVVSMAAMLAAFAALVFLVFPARMESFSRRSMERGVMGMAVIVADGVSPGLDMDDGDAARVVLASMEKAEDLEYAVVRRSDGTTLVALHPERVPNEEGVRVERDPKVIYAGDELRVYAPVQGKMSRGTLNLGFSLATIEREKHAQRVLVGVVSLLFVLLGIGTSFVVATLFVRPIERVTAVALGIAAGDLSQSVIQGEGQDEIGRMADAFNRMLASLRALAVAADRIANGDLTGNVQVEGAVGEAFNRMIDGQRTVVRKIAEASVQLGVAAKELYASAQDQEHAATRQSAAIEQVIRTMQSLLDSAAHIAESARGVLANAERSKETTETGIAKIADLRKHANRMGELLDVIRDIADRSDLLALNASLEATRAGDAGRAFALVATEMRRLAERVTASVHDVKSLVADVHASGASTVLATDEGRKLAESTTGSARQITLVTQQQRTGTEQVSQSMRDISTLLARSVTAAEQLRSAAGGLKIQAEELTTIVGGFQVDDGRGVS